MRKSVIFCAIVIALITTCSYFRSSIWLKVTNGKGGPISGVLLRFSWSTGEPWGPSLRSGTPHNIDKTSNVDGLVSVRISEDQYISVSASARGYYPGVITIVGDSLRKHPSAANALPFPLKQIQAPTAFIGKKANIILPSREGKAGYDFIVGDLVAPYGKGQHQDIMINWSYDPKRDGGYHKRALWDCHFTAPAGIQAHRPDALDSSSFLVSDPIAPITGYSASLRLAENHESFGERGPWGPVIYYFTTERSNKTLYGKILGEPEIIYYSNGKTVIKLTYMINPSGSTSLEPDMNHATFPKQNGWEEEYKFPEST